MIHIQSPINEPPQFDEKCRQQGQAWLAGRVPLPDRPKDFWSPFRRDLRHGFNQRCGYYAMYIHDGQMDHSVSWKTCKDNTPELAYEWSNFRFVDGALNSRKRTLDDQLLDPFEVRAGWFVVELPTLFLRAVGVPDERREAARLTLERLELDQGPRALELRWEWYDAYLRRQLSMELLREMAPLVAEAIEQWQANDRGPLPEIPRPVPDPFAGMD